MFKKIKDTPSNRIKGLLEDYYKKVLSKNKSYKHCRREKPLTILNVRNVNAKGFRYVPEIYFQKKTGNIISFQVFDSQDRKGIAGDILCSYFTSNLKWAYFILVAKDEKEAKKKEETINELITAVESQFADEFNCEFLPQVLASAMVLLETETKNEKEFFNKIDERRKKDKW